MATTNLGPSYFQADVEASLPGSRGLVFRREFCFAIGSRRDILKCPPKVHIVSSNVFAASFFIPACSLAACPVVDTL